MYKVYITTKDDEILVRVAFVNLDELCEILDSSRDVISYLICDNAGRIIRKAESDFGDKQS